MKVSEEASNKWKINCSDKNKWKHFNCFNTSCQDEVKLRGKKNLKYNFCRAILSTRVLLLETVARRQHFKTVQFTQPLIQTPACRSSFMKTRTSRVIATNAALTVLTSVPTLVTVTPSEWRVGPGSSTRDPSIWATSMSSWEGSTPTTRAGMASMTPSAPVASSDM